MFRWQNETTYTAMEKCFASTQYPTERYRPVFEITSATGLAISDGVYFLRNVASGIYLDVENQTMQNGTTIHQWQFSGSHTSQWSFEWQSDGYYTIRSCKDQNYYLGVSGDSSVEHAVVVLRTGTVTDGMKWKVLEESTGVYKLVSFAGEANNRVLAVQTSNTNQASDGLKILSSTYSSNDYNNDLWILEAFGTPQCRLLAWNEAYNIPRNGYFSTTSEVAEKTLGLNVYTNYYTAISKQGMKRALFDAGIFMVHTHGIASGFVLDSAQTYLTLDDIGSMSLDNLTLAMFLTCNSANGYAYANVVSNTPTNLVEKMECNGVDVVIGFSTTTYVADCNQFADLFMEGVAKGKVVAEIVNGMKDEAFMEPIYNNCVIGGNANLNLLEVFS